MDPIPQLASDNPLTPQVKMQRAVFAVLAVGYAAFSFARSDFYMPGKHGPGVHLHGPASWFLECMLLFAAGALFSPMLGRKEESLLGGRAETLRRYLASTAYALMGFGTFFDLIKPSLLPTGSLAPWLSRDVLWLIIGAIFSLLGRLPPTYARKKTKRPVTPSRIWRPSIGRISVALIAAVIAFITWLAAVFRHTPLPDPINLINGNFFIFWGEMEVGTAAAVIVWLSLSPKTLRPVHSLAAAVSILVAAWFLLQCINLYLCAPLMPGVFSNDRIRRLTWASAIVILVMARLTWLLLRNREKPNVFAH